MQDRESRIPELTPSPSGLYGVVTPFRRTVGVERLATIAVLIASVLFTLWMVWQGVDFVWRFNAFINNINQRVTVLEAQRGVNPPAPNPSNK